MGRTIEQLYICAMQYKRTIASLMRGIFVIPQILSNTPYMIMKKYISRISGKVSDF